MIRALIFDFDGLIIDTERPSFQSWQEIYQAHGCELSLEAWARCIGTSNHAFDPHTHLEGQLGQALEREALRQKHRDRRQELVAAEVVLPGVRQYLADARRLGLKQAVASSSTRDWVAGHLARHKLLPFFDCLKCADDVARVKPDPALYQSALAGLGVAPGEAIAFEDSPNGIRAAKGAGLFCVAVPNELTRQLPLDEADLKLDSLHDLTLEELLARAGRHG